MKVTQSSPYFNAYYRDNKILIQFVLSEFFAAYTQSYQIMQLAVPTESRIIHLDDPIPKITQSILDLVGSDHNNSRPWTSEWGTGTLFKLKKNTELLSSNAHHQNKTLFKLHKSIYRAWIYSQNCLEMVKCAQSPYSTFNSQPFNSMHLSLNIASKFLLKAVHQYTDNKNVLLFLKRHEDELITIYGKNAVEQLIPQNLESLQSIDLQSEFNTIFHTHV